MLAIRDLGLRIPEDVAIVGSNEARWSRVVDPPLTMVQTDSYELGRSAAQLLLRRIAGDLGGMPVVIRVPRILDIHESSGRPRGAVPLVARPTVLAAS